VAQAKSAFAALWTLLRRGDWLTTVEAQVVERLVPPTSLASAGWLERARARPEDWVLKPVLGRYSERVVLGALASVEAWQSVLDAASAAPDEWIVQAFIPPRRCWLPSADGGRAGYVNWGVYLADGEPAGICPRFQPTPLTDESATWWAPLVLSGERPVGPTVLEPHGIRWGRDAGLVWRTIADRHALDGYTNSWTDGLANFTLAAIGLTPGSWDDLAHATLVVGRAVDRVLAHLRGRPELLGVLGIPEAVARLCSQPTATEDWNLLSRFDWAWTSEGWKLLEINSDTPAGLWETGSIEGDVARRTSGGGSRQAGGAAPSTPSEWARPSAYVPSDWSALSACPKTPISCAPMRAPPGSPCLARAVASARWTISPCAAAASPWAAGRWLSSTATTHWIGSPRRAGVRCSPPSPPVESRCCRPPRR